MSAPTVLPSAPRPGETPPVDEIYDGIVAGAGAAGLMTAIVAAREAPAGRFLLLEGSARTGTKILVSGGGRCNVTHHVVRASDYHGADRGVVARVLRRFDEQATLRFFGELGVELKYEPEFGKMFPVTDSARTVLDALLNEAAARGVAPRENHRVTAVRAEPDGTFLVDAPGGPWRTRRVVLTTGGKAMPTTGSDGVAYAFATAFGHTLREPVPALVPLILDPNPFAGLAGVSFRAELRAVGEGGKVLAKAEGPVLVTHFGVSGPAVLDISRHWSRGAAEGRAPDIHLSVFPGREPHAVEKDWLAAGDAGGGRFAAGTLFAGLPHRIAQRLAAIADIPIDRRLSDLTRASRSRLLGAATSLRLPVRETRGFAAAEVTAGGIPLEETDVRTMESRLRPGLHLAGEILDVEGRLGGFNFQWAWASGFVCGQALAAAARSPAPGGSP